MNVTKRGNKWQYDFRLNGKRHRKSGFKTKKEATQAMNEAYNTLHNGSNLTSDMPFVDFFENWIEIHKTPYLTDKSLQTYYNAKNIFEKKFGNMPLDKITRMNYQELINDYAETHTSESVRKLNYCLRSALSDAFYEGMIQKDPTYKVIVQGKKEAQAEEDKFMQLSYFYKLKEFSKEKDQLSYLFIYLCIVTGARFSEVQKLKYQDFNLNDETVHIRGTKTKNADRIIKITKEDIKHVRKVLNNFPDNIQGNIFTTGANLITHNAVTKVLQRFCLENKLGNYTLHSLRHTHCSMLIHNGISIYYISKRLGHADITTTLSIYSHLLEETKSVEENKTLEALRSM